MLSRFTRSAVIGSLLLVPVLGAVPAQAAAGPAAAAACAAPHTPSDLDSGQGSLKAAYDLRASASAECGAVASGAANQKVDFWCWDTGTDGGPWVYGQLQGTSSRGWAPFSAFTVVVSDDFPACG